MKTIWIYSALLTGTLSGLGKPLSAQSTAPATAETELSRPTIPLPEGTTSLFDGKTLDGWIADPATITTFSSSDITDLPALVKKISARADEVSAYLSDQLDDAGKSALAAFAPDDSAGQKQMRSTLAKALNKAVGDPDFCDSPRFGDVQLRPQTQQLLDAHPKGDELSRLNRMLLEDTYPSELWKSPMTAWTVNDGIMCSTGAGAGFCTRNRITGNSG